jgi:protein-S-isoprenylcysteine O-methyltransferase Ste14
MVGPREVMGLLWAVWAASWFAAAFWRRPTRARTDLRTEAGYRLALLLGFVALFLPLATQLPPVLEWPAPLSWGLTLLATAGFGVCWWARIHIGPLWSAAITRKEGHRVVDTGPYAHVRHPIYTGILIACLAVALLEAHIVSTLGAIVVFGGLIQKARLEEEFLKKELGAKAYGAYAARVPMLVPLLRVKPPGA